MGHAQALRVVLIKPSKYGLDGAVERFLRGFMPNATLPHMASLTPPEVAGHRVELHAIDEYVECDLKYLRWLERDPDCTTLIALVGVQTHQFHRALDLAAYARAHGVEHVVIGGPHPMVCDTTVMHGRGVSFALAEAELIWMHILEDAVAGQLRPVYGADVPWQQVLDPPVLIPPTKRDLRRYIVPMLGVYPARGCPYRCNFCSVIQIAGRQIRSQPVETTLATLRAAKAAGVALIMFTTDNFNKYAEAETLLQAIIDERLDLGFFVQCDTQVVRQPRLVELLGRAGCYQMFVGVESFNRETLLGAKKNQNHPARYRELVQLCHEYGIGAHFSNIIGFPEDTEAVVLENLRILRELRPDVASFYILTPGGAQYEEFLDAGLITERNMDRCDASCATWRHPHISDERLVDLLFHCYTEFFADVDLSSPDTFAKLARWPERRSADSLAKISAERFALFCRVAVAARRHPMAGGLYWVTRDRVDDYSELRKRFYGFELAPHPRLLRPHPDPHWQPPVAQ
jgi:pyruvate-formate lyase-activating enzyme